MRFYRFPVLAVSVAILFVIYFIILYCIRDLTERQFFSDAFLQWRQRQLDVRAPSECHIPRDIDPFDVSVVPFLRSMPDRIQCGDGQPTALVTYVTGDGWLRKNDTIDGCCRYRWLERTAGDDDTVHHSKWFPLATGNGVQLNRIENYVQVKCDHPYGYENLHYYFRPKPKRPHNGDDVSVFILVIESLSRINYHRYLNRTRSVLEHQMGNIFYLDGLNKMWDNSFPNMAPLLTGHRLYNNELPDENRGPYDRWPLIWGNYSRQRGYQTALVEDYPSFTLFNYMSKGFVDGPPTDFYPRPFWLQLFKEYAGFHQKLFPFNLDLCYRNRIPKLDIFLDQAYHFVAQCSAIGQPFFGFFFYIELTHQDFNKAQLADYHLAEFLRRSMWQLNRSLVVVMGDHGSRYGPILQTRIGRIEERMPLVAVHVPERLLARHPHLAHNLRDNRFRLTTWLDLHEMLKDILKDDYEEKANNNQRGYSPWRQPIPTDRDCRSAEIPDLYCICDERVALERNSSLAITASVAVVDHLNRMLANQSRCARLVATEVHSAELILPSGSTVQYRGYRQYVEITNLVQPSGGMFRTRLYRTARHPDQWMVQDGQVTRINRYGNQSACISFRNLKPFCYCN